MSTILGLQQDLILNKARDLGNTEAAVRARTLIETSREVSALKGKALLYPAEYRTRADALVDARRLVGGVDIEKVASGRNRLQPALKRDATWAGRSSPGWLARAAAAAAAG